MKITSDKKRTQNSRVIQIEGMEATPVLSATHRGKLYIPDCVSASWVDDQPVDYVSIYGYVLKADGTPGKYRAEQMDRIDPSAQYGRIAPQWVRDLFTEPTA